MKKFVTTVLMSVVAVVAMMAFLNIALARMEEVDRAEFTATINYLEDHVASYAIVRDGSVTFSNSRTMVVSPCMLEVPDELVGTKGIGGVIGNRFYMSFADNSTASIVVTDMVKHLSLDLRFPIYVE